ncbi:hypothetical protein M0R45_017498 [Rubus argutus]|uniref:Uncharacterized protein n=1 Tax=Rubus argutus TaxID=59490 RepID=A0AAW1XYI4_RUBAR
MASQLTSHYRSGHQHSCIGAIDHSLKNQLRFVIGPLHQFLQDMHRIESPASTDPMDTEANPHLTQMYMEARGS